MNITSLTFILFAIVALGIYYLLPRRSQNVWLLFVSYAFLVSWSWQFAVILGLVTTANFVIALRLRVDDHGRRGLLWVGICFNVFILIFFRSANFFLPGLEALLGRLGFPGQADGLQILLPLGLSYYILQTISYLVDVYRRQLKAESDWVAFALYLAYFPKLIAGPIERAHSFLPKLARRRTVDNGTIARGLSLIFVGIVRKLLIADILAGSILSDVFAIPSKYTPPELIGWLVIYAFALYNDFAGYSDIVRGVSGLFGIELSRNFKTPYFSRNFSEFWQRWHITLSQWLRDYIYFPISRLLRRKNPTDRVFSSIILPPTVTMLFSGLWHGFGPHMLIWGGLHALYLILERIWNLWGPPISSQRRSIGLHGLSMVIVSILVIFAWIPFRWGLHSTFDFWEALADWSNTAIRYRRLFLVLPVLFLSVVIDFVQFRNQDEFIFLKWPRWVQATCMAVLFLLGFIATAGDFELPFVYQAF